MRRRALGDADEATTATRPTRQQTQQQRGGSESDDSEPRPTRTPSRVERLARVVYEMLPTLAPARYCPGGAGDAQRAAGKASAALLYAGGTSAEEASIFAAALPGVPLAGGFLQVRMYTSRRRRREC